MMELDEGHQSQSQDINQDANEANVNSGGLEHEISVTQLDSIKTKPQFGGPPLYEQLMKTKMEDNR